MPWCQVIDFISCFLLTFNNITVINDLLKSKFFPIFLDLDENLILKKGKKKKSVKVKVPVSWIIGAELLTLNGKMLYDLSYFCYLLTVFCYVLFIVHCSLFIVHYPLFIVHCLVCLACCDKFLFYLFSAFLSLFLIYFDSFK